MHLGTREGWVQKKPTSSSGKSWGESRPQRRYLESRGLVIRYYADAPQKRAAVSKPRGLFDLRDVTMLRGSQDPTAPSAALDLIAKKHQFTLAFENDTECQAFLRLWVNGVPISSVPRPLAEKYFDAEIAQALAACTGDSRPHSSEGDNSLPVEDGSVSTSKDGW